MAIRRMFQFRGLGDGGELWRPEATVAPTPLRLEIGSSGPEVIWVQDFLRGNNFLKIVTTDSYDLSTYTAVLTYQKAAGITEPIGQGKVGPTTWNVMHGGGTYSSTVATTFYGGTILRDRVLVPKTVSEDTTLKDALAAIAAADKAVAEKAAVEAAVAKADFERLMRMRAEGDQGERGGDLIPQHLKNIVADAKADAEAAEEAAEEEAANAEERAVETKERARRSQRALEEVSIGARIGAAAKWAFVPAGVGALMLAMGRGKLKPIGGAVLVTGIGLGLFRFFRGPGGIDSSMEAEES